MAGLPFGPVNLNVTVGGMATDLKKYCGVDDVMLDMTNKILAASILQIMHCTSGNWKKNDVKIELIEGQLWDNYVVYLCDDCVFQMQESSNGYTVTWFSFGDWMDMVRDEAMKLAQRFGPM